MKSYAHRPEYLWRIGAGTNDGVTRPGLENGLRSEIDKLWEEMDIQFGPLKRLSNEWRETLSNHECLDALASELLRRDRSDRGDRRFFSADGTLSPCQFGTRMSRELPMATLGGSRESWANFKVPREMLMEAA